MILAVAYDWSKLIKKRGGVVKERIFRIISNSESHLTADTIAMALLEQVTIKETQQTVSFAVVDVTGGKYGSKENVCAFTQRN